MCRWVEERKRVVGVFVETNHTRGVVSSLSSESLESFYYSTIHPCSRYTRI